MPRYKLRTLLGLRPLEWLVIIALIVVALSVFLTGFPIDFDAPPRR